MKGKNSSAIRPILELIIIMIAASCSLSDYSAGSQDETVTSRPEEFRVSLKELINYAFSSIDGITRTNVTSIEPIEYQGDTVLFLVNYKRGWKLFSADKRTSPVIAYSIEEKLTDELLEKNPLFREWLDCQCAYIHAIARNPKGEINPFWNQPEMDGETRTHEFGEPGWRLIHLGDTLIVNQAINHIIQTQWGQDYPWNGCTPYLRTGFSTRALTGCVNVAYAQLLYWAHSVWGIPEYMYTNADCTGALHPNKSYSFSFIDSSMTAWNQIRESAELTGNADFAGYLMAKVSRYTETDYYGDEDVNGITEERWTESSFSPSQLTWLRQVFDLDGVFSSYTSTSVITNLYNQIPTLISARWNPLWGHTWIIDGYQHETHKTKYFYIWDPDNTYVAPYNEEEEEEEDDPHQQVYGHGYSFIFPEGYETYSTEITSYQQYYLMNWGWDGFGNSVFCDIYAAGWTPDGLVSPLIVSTANILTDFTPYNLNE